MKSMTRRPNKIEVWPPGLAKCVWLWTIQYILMFLVCSWFVTKACVAIVINWETGRAGRHHISIINSFSVDIANWTALETCLDCFFFVPCYAHPLTLCTPLFWRCWCNKRQAMAQFVESMWCKARMASFAKCTFDMYTLSSTWLTSILLAQ